MEDLSLTYKIAQRRRPRGASIATATARRPLDAALGVADSFGFGWLGILLLRLNLPEFVAIRSGFKALRRLFGTVTYRGQDQCSVLNLEEGSDNLADGISTLGRRIIFDCGV